MVRLYDLSREMDKQMIDSFWAFMFPFMMTSCHAISGVVYFLGI